VDECFNKLFGDEKVKGSVYFNASVIPQGKLQEIADVGVEWKSKNKRDIVKTFMSLSRWFHLCASEVFLRV
jgi:hypothetical protein